MDNKEKKKSGFKKIIVGALAILGVLFIIIMLMPDDEEEKISGNVEQSVAATVDSTNSKKDNSPFSGEENVEVVSVGTDAKSATIMVYMNGSDLETNAGEATTDLSEMISSGIGNNVNVIVQTMGTKKWQNYGISSNTAQTYKIENGVLTLVRDNLGQLDCTASQTLSEFIGFCKSNYPADRYIFLFWNHGGGPVYGFGYDEWQSDDSSLTIAEMAKAFSENNDIHFDIIGMDCCIMASMETCYALAPYCKYALLSEDFESGLGWNYKGWMNAFEKNTGISTPLLGKYIVDDIIEDNENSFAGDSACMGLFNVSTAKNLFTAWKNYAYKNESALLNKNYSRMHRAKKRSRNKGFWDSWGFDDSDVTLKDYYISDILALMESIDNSSDEAKNLMSALKAAVAYYGHTSDKNELTGLAVSLPYGDSYFYDRLKSVYSDINLDKEYIDWLGAFVSSSGNSNYYDYGGFENSWDGWGSYENDYGCNISNGGSCEYSYNYDDSNYYYYDYDNGNSEYCDDWIYDYDEEIWYLYEGDTLYLYDDETDTMYYYDEYSDKFYYYDERYDDWIEVRD
ncbi:clostripain-related cysteine peptidase [Butyrivibrio sp. YAB3001]|uniref:clostripain-related cysteine peptidase n=1 Tax=Butyrivibrio sp. YAB3001 TaxID=1520812 RepID=UPI0008F64505|nr:clostripain-related cysteine peptidase [Butyrivibrio sp. YAB3001]SFC48445.1 hypothetical protein SAMN02910398_02367 [Butyrivibrio sp. YAB3001]